MCKSLVCKIIVQTNTRNINIFNLLLLDEFIADEAAEVKPDSQYATSILADDYAVSLVNVDNFVEPEFSKKSPYIRAVTSEIVSVFKEIASLNPLFRDQIASFSMAQSAGNVFDEPSKLADFAAAVSAGEASELQEVLETLPVEERLQKSLVVLKKELMNAQLQNKISKDVESKIAKRQREYYLMEQLKGIKKELGLESDGKDKLVEGFKEKAAKLAMPATVKKVFDEVKKFFFFFSFGPQKANTHHRKSTNLLTLNLLLLNSMSHVITLIGSLKFLGVNALVRTTTFVMQLPSWMKTIMVLKM